MTVIIPYLNLSVIKEMQINKIPTKRKKIRGEIHTQTLLVSIIWKIDLDILPNIQNS
jgi:hypothetical protein